MAKFKLIKSEFKTELKYNKHFYSFNYDNIEY